MHQRVKEPAAGDPHGGREPGASSDLLLHVVEVNLNQTTTIVGYLPNTAKVHAVEAKPKAKSKAKAAASLEGPKAASAPSLPIKSEGPAPPKTPVPATTPRGENAGKGKGKGEHEGFDRATVNKKGQQCIRFFRGNCTRGDDCQYGHILGTDGKPLKIALELVARFDKHAAAKREAKKKVRFRLRCLC